MRARTNRIAIMGGTALALVLLLPVSAMSDLGVDDLPGTVWAVNGRVKTTGRAAGETATSSGKTGTMTIEFVMDDAVRIDSDKYGIITGSYAPHAKKRRRIEGTLDEESLAEALADYERREERAIRRQLGVRASVNANPTKTRFRATLSRSGEKLRATATVKFKGRVSASGGNVRFRGAFTLRLKGTQDAD